MIGTLIRNNRFLAGQGNESSNYLNVGCGPFPIAGFVNLDYAWSTDIDVCWDITKPFSFDNTRFEGIFSEHCLEHVSLEEGLHVLREFYRILKPGGLVRIIVPDGGLYFRLYNQRMNGERVILPYEEGFESPMRLINMLFYAHGHRFIYDYETLEQQLMKAGFKNIFQRSFREGKLPALLIDREDRKVESLYIEAEK